MPDVDGTDTEPDCTATLPPADPERLHRRAVLLREIAEARARVIRAVPWRAGTARLRISGRRRRVR